MLKIQIPFGLNGLALKPEIKGQQEVDEKLIQTLATLFGFDGAGRRLLTCSLSGSLHTVSPPVCCIVNKVSTGAAEDMTFGDIPVTEIMIRANPLNTGNVWVNVGASAAVDTGWPLVPGEVILFSVNNMRDVRLHVVTSGDKVIIVRAG